MEKIKINQLGILPEIEEKDVQIGNVIVSIKTKIPYEEVLVMIEWNMSYILGDRPFISAPLRQIISDLGLVRYYTNLDLSMMDDPNIAPDEIYETYDLLTNYNAFNIIKDTIDSEQLNFFNWTLDKTMENIVMYNNSIHGVIDYLSQNANELGASFNSALDVLKDPEQLTQVKKLVEVANENK